MFQVQNKISGKELNKADYPIEFKVIVIKTFTL